MPRASASSWQALGHNDLLLSFRWNLYALARIGDHPYSTSEIVDGLIA